MPSVEAPASISLRTVAIQSGSGLVAGRSPLPTMAQPSGVSFQVESAFVQTPGPSAGARI